MQFTIELPKHCKQFGNLPRDYQRIAISLVIYEKIRKNCKKFGNWMVAYQRIAKNGNLTKNYQRIAKQLVI